MMLSTVASAQSHIQDTDNSYSKKLKEIITGKVVLPENNLSEELSAKKTDLDSKNSMIPKSPPSLISSKETNTEYQKSLQAYYGYKIRGFEHRSRVFEWQLFSSKLLFAVVLILVFSGVIFAGIQFYVGIKAEKEQASFNTEISVSQQGFKISSPIIGLIVLTLSLAFFYLYLIYVFPIEEIF